MHSESPVKGTVSRNCLPMFLLLQKYFRIYSQFQIQRDICMCKKFRRGVKHSGVIETAESNAALLLTPQSQAQLCL